MVTRAGPLPLSPTIATLAVHRLQYAYGAPTVRLRYACGTPAVLYSLIAYSATAVDRLQ
jgi:hypothetical protein